MEGTGHQFEQDPEAGFGHSHAPDQGFESQVTELPGTGGDPEVRRAVVEALARVHDPELGVNIVDLGLVYDLTIEDKMARVTYTLTTMGCPIGPMIESQMAKLVDEVPGIEGFEAEMVFRPSWSPELMSEEAKVALGVM